DRVVPAQEQGGMLWVRRAAGSTTELQSNLERILDGAGAPLASVFPLSVFKSALVAHFELLMKTLLALAALTAVVGGLSLGSAMSIAVVTRTRELAVLRTVGASRRQVGQSILLEGVLVGGLSLVGAGLLGGTLALIVGYTIGKLSFKIPLPWTFSWSAIGLWGLGMLLLTLLAT
ncbi:MAG TPA: FtsX-like permease family protein, partial [Polyangiaceae bacterium]|nr:FtsX-like permease family protein [Polyangiaceae bacterium]